MSAHIELPTDINNSGAIVKLSPHLPTNFNSPVLTTDDIKGSKWVINSKEKLVLVDIYIPVGSLIVKLSDDAYKCSSLTVGINCKTVIGNLTYFPMLQTVSCGIFTFNYNGPKSKYGFHFYENRKKALEHKLYFTK